MSGLTLGSLGGAVSETELRSRLLAADALSQAPRQTFVNLKRANELLAAASRSSDKPEARKMVVAAKTLFTRAEYDCEQSGAAYCKDPKVEAYAALFRRRLSEVEFDLSDPGPPPQIYTSSIDTGPGYVPPGPVYGPPSPADVAAARAEWDRQNPPQNPAVTQRVVAQTNLRNQQAQTRPGSSVSAHAQAAKIRGQWAATRAPVPSYPQPMSSPQQNQLILATRARQGGLGTGAKIAAFGLLGVAVLSVGALIFGRRQ